MANVSITIDLRHQLVSPKNKKKASSRKSIATQNIFVVVIVIHISSSSWKGYITTSTMSLGNSISIIINSGCVKTKLPSWQLLVSSMYLYWCRYWYRIRIRVIIRIINALALVKEEARAFPASKFGCSNVTKTLCFCYGNVLLQRRHNVYPYGPR